MITLLKSWKGPVEINGTRYNSIKDAPSTLSGDIHIKLLVNTQNVVSDAGNAPKAQIVDACPIEYKITVKKYMTEKASPSFDFMSKWNNNNPMPMRTMQGTVLQETKGMIKMKLHGLALATINCSCCGKELTNPISRHYGIGPICLSKIGIVRDISDIENIKEDLENIEWEGWIIKSAITEREEV